MAVAQSSFEELSTASAQTFYGAEEMLIPGKGEAADRCGEYRADGFCDGAAHGGDSHVILRAHQCGRRECPRCWSAQWARKRTVAAVARLGAARHAAGDDLDKRAVHVAISPPEGAVESVTDLYRYRTKAVEKAREHGVRGGLVVPHPWRVTDEAKAAFQDARDDGLDCAQSGVWRFVRENSEPWRSQVVFAPHYHVVGLSRDVKAGDGSEGWVVKNIERNGSHALEPFYIRNEDGYEDMAATVRYLLSHAGFEKDGNRQAVTWFGSLHGTNFDPEAALTVTAWDRIQRTAEEVAGIDRDDPGEGGEDDEPCPVEGCPGEVYPIGAFSEFSKQHSGSLGKLNLMVLRTALRWHEGLDPPPGLHGPECAEDATEALLALLQGNYAGTRDWEKLRDRHGSGEAVVEEARERFICT